MKTNDIEQERETAIHLLRSGRTTQEVATKCQRSTAWVRKWRRRYAVEGWVGLAGHSKAPKRHGQQLSKATERAIVCARSELEAEAARGKGLKYIGARAVRTRLKQKRLRRVPSRATIERVLKQAGMTRPYEQKAKPAEIKYPHLHPTASHQLIQVDIVPHFLTGGSRAVLRHRLLQCHRCGLTLSDRSCLYPTPLAGCCPLPDPRLADHRHSPLYAGG